MMKIWKIGTRESRLAMEQTALILRSIREKMPEIPFEICGIKTTGDRILDRPLAQIGGKGLFMKELEYALLEGSIDLAVHSLKDMPMLLPQELPILAYSDREDERDVLVLRRGLTALPKEPLFGCGSLRRQMQLHDLFPGCRCESVRGNVITRLQKLDEGQFDALVLAAAGLKRLHREDRISRYFSVEEMVPAAGQGILAVQGRQDERYPFLSAVENAESRDAAVCERAFVSALQGGCTAPVAAHAAIEGEDLVLTGFYGKEQPERNIRMTDRGPRTQAEELGSRLAREVRKAAEL